MASLPGVPGNLGQPAVPPSGNSDHSPDLPLTETGTITLANKVITAELQGSASGTIAIPSTTAGNLIVVLATMTLGSAQHPILTISDNALDVFANPAWSTLGNTDAGPGEMFRYSGGDGNLHFYDDCAYAQTAGEATILSWALTNEGSAGAVSIEFFIYELAGFSSWLLKDFQGAGVSNAVLDSTNYPYVGPSLTASDTNDAYFTTCNIAFNFFPEISLGAIPDDPAWTLDNPNGSGTNAATFLLNASGAQQSTFDRQSSLRINNSEIGVVFGPGTLIVGGGGTPPPDTEEFLPNVWIVS